MIRRLLALLAALLMALGIAPALAADASVIPLRTVDDLLAIATNPAGHYRLENDIDMKGVRWQPLAFSGTLDGGNHVLYNLSIDTVGADRAQTVDGNHKKYDTGLAGLFSVVRDAQIRDLHLLGVQVMVTDEGSCFAAGLAGFAENTTITGCSVLGRVHLTQKGRIGGVAGLVGFGYGQFDNNSTDVELVFVDDNRKTKCEEFLGAILACGYGDVRDNRVKLSGYASVHGYVHNGGLVGMYHVHVKQDEEREGYVTGNRVEAVIRFFEHVAGDRRAYCKPFVGEKLNRPVQIEDNEEISFEKIESKKYKVNLLPEVHENPDYITVTVQPTDIAFGYTMHTCTQCKHTYSTDYVAPKGGAI